MGSTDERVTHSQALRGTIEGVDERISTVRRLQVMKMAHLSTLIKRDDQNATLSGLLCVFLVGIAGAGVLSANPGWTAFATAGLVVALIPAGLRRDHLVFPPWEILLLVTVPIFVQAIDLSMVVTEIATYIAVVALAALCIVELHMFSAVEMSEKFAAVLIVLMTMAIAGLWTICRWLFDTLLGTTYLAGLSSLMWGLVIATGIGMLGGPLFSIYLRSHGSVGTQKINRHGASK